MAHLKARLLMGAALALPLAMGLGGGKAWGQAQVIDANQAATVDLAGTFGIDDPLVTVANGVTITAGAGDGILGQTIAWTLSNLGSVIGDANGVTFTAAGAVGNAGTALIQGGDSGIDIRGGAGSVGNMGTILGDGRYGVILFNGGTVDNAGTGVIQGGLSGVVLSTGTGLVTNSSTIRGLAEAGVKMGAGSLVNSGLIDGVLVGVQADGGGTVTSSGTILGQGAYASGVVLSQGGTVVNMGAGLIQGGATGIRVQNAPGLVTNAGTIRGTDADGIGIGTYGVSTVVNTGTIAGGTASVLGYGGLTLVLDTGSVLVGTAAMSERDDEAPDRVVLLGINREDDDFLNFGTLDMLGSFWSLTGTGIFDRANILLGTLSADGTLGGLVDVSPGAKLAGNGVIQGSVTNRGTLAPGNSIGTLTVMGAFSFADDSTFEVEIEPGGTSDLLLASGAISIAGGTVSVFGGSGSFSNGMLFTIANGATVAGTFDNLVDDLAFIDTSLMYTPAMVLLGLNRNMMDVDDVARTRNQRAVSRALDVAETAGNLGPVLGAIFALNADQARAALDSLSGEIHASAQDAVLAAGERFTRTVLRRDGEQAALLPGEDSGARVWVRPFGGVFSVDGDGNAGGFDETGGGIAGGIAFAFGDGFEAGAAIGYETSSIDFDRSADADFDIIEGGVYGRFASGGFHLEGALAFGAVSGDTTRQVMVGSLAETARGDIEGTQIAARLETGFAFDLGDGAIFQPLASLSFTSFDRDGFNEEGAPATGLKVGSETAEQVTAGLGARLAGTFATDGGWTIAPEARLGLAFDLSDEEEVTNEFLGSPGNPFTVFGPDQGGVGLTAGIGLTAGDGDGLEFFLDAEAGISDGTSEGLATAGIKFSW
jgi:uncharacterized protein with beta-barrel porin domain